MSDKRMDKETILNEPDANAEAIPVDAQAGESSNENLLSEIDQLKSELKDTKEKYLRLVAEFDNFRKRNAREKIELIQTASKDVLVSLLEVLDDADRAQKQLETSSDVDPGIQLVFNKLRNVLLSKGIKKMEVKGSEFNPDLHEAVAEIPAGPQMKGKVVDVVQDGYYLNDKIIRFAKVVVGK